MADKRFSDLDPVTALGDADLFAVSQGGVSKKATGSQLKAYSGGFVASIPFYKANGTLDTIPLTAESKLPFYKSNGSASNITLITA